jgi:molybdopterin synthase catalytic subunit
MPSYEIGRSEIFFGKHSKNIGKPPRSTKIPQLNVNIYQPLTAEQWERVAKETKEYFEYFDIRGGSKAPKPLWDKIKSKLIALKTLGPNATKRTSSGLITDRETTRQIIVDTYPDISPSDMKKMLSQLSKERERVKVLLASRLGKTEVDEPVTKP